MLGCFPFSQFFHPLLQRRFERPGQSHIFAASVSVGPDFGVDSLPHRSYKPLPPLRSGPPFARKPLRRAYRRQRGAKDRTGFERTSPATLLILSYLPSALSSFPFYLQPTRLYQSCDEDLSPPGHRTPRRSLLATLLLRFFPGLRVVSLEMILSVSVDSASFASHWPTLAPLEISVGSWAAPPLPCFLPPSPKIFPFTPVEKGDEFIDSSVQSTPIFFLPPLPVTSLPPLPSPLGPAFDAD